MTIWDPPDLDLDPDPDRDHSSRRTTSAHDAYDSSTLDLTLAVLIIGVIGVAVYFLGKLLWIVWPTLW